MNLVFENSVRTWNCMVISGTGRTFISLCSCASGYNISALQAVCGFSIRAAVLLIRNGNNLLSAMGITLVSV